MPTEKLGMISQRPAGIMKTTNLDFDSENWRQAYTSSYFPYHLAWNTDATTLAEREKTYRKILEHAYPSKDSRSYQLSLFKIKPRVNKPGDFVEENPTDPMSNEEFEHDPLHFLRSQQPHLSSEINTFYLKHCQVVVGNAESGENLLVALQWLQTIGAGSASRLRRLQICTTTQELSHQSSKLIKIFDYLGSVYGFQDSRSIDLCIKQYAEEKYNPSNHDTDFRSTTVVEISGLSWFALQLMVHLTLEERDGYNNVPDVIEDSFRVYCDPYRRKATRDHSITWCFSRFTRRVDFLERLPPEIRILIHQKANGDYDQRTAACLKVWSSSLHCHRNRLVSRHFAEDSKAAFYNTRAFEFRLQESHDYKVVYGFLKLAGPEIVRSLKDLTFHIHESFHTLENWSSMFSWLVNVLVVSTSTPITSRELGRFTLLSWEVILPGWKLNSRESGEAQQCHLKDFHFEEFSKHYPERQTDKFQVQLVAKAKVHLATNSVKVRRPSFSISSPNSL